MAESKLNSRLTMKNVLTILFLFICSFVNATNYYVSNNGSDIANGLTEITTWQTLQKVNNSIYIAGDSILFKNGDTFYGSLVVNRSNLVFASYGAGAKPLITGSKTVTAWTNLGANIWESTNSVSSLATCNMVSINGVNAAMGRYPNTGYLTFQSHINNTSISSSSLTGTPNWTGADVNIRTVRYGIDRAKVTAHLGSTLTYTSLYNIEGAAPLDGFGFFMQNDSRTLDTLNEWYYNPVNNKLKVYSIATPANVQLATIDTLVFINAYDYVTFDNISFEGSNKISIKSFHGQHLVIRNCDFNYSGFSGIEADNASDYLTVDSCSFNHSNDIAINSDTSNRVTITRNNIKNSGVFPGMGSYYYWGAITHFFGHHKGIMADGDYGNISYNTIDSTGYNPLVFSGDSTIVQNNFITNFCFVLDDGGGIYTYTEAPNKLWKTRTIKGNIILNGIGAGVGTDNLPNAGNETSGIYLDGYMGNVNILNNTVSNCNVGIYLYNSHEIIASYNTLYDNQSQFQLVNYRADVKMDNIALYDNIFFAKLPTQWTFHLRLLPDSVMPLKFTAANNYYIRPMDDSFTILYSRVYDVHSKTLAQWKIFTGKDANSKRSPKTILNINELRFEYNATGINKTVALTGSWVDARGIYYNNSITLPPYSSVVLIQDNEIRNYRYLRKRKAFKSI